MRRIIAVIPNNDVRKTALDALHKLGFKWNSEVAIPYYAPTNNKMGGIILMINLSKRTIQYDNRPLESIQQIKEAYPFPNDRVVQIHPKEVEHLIAKP